MQTNSVKLLKYDNLLNKLDHKSIREQADDDTFSTIATFYGYNVEYTDADDCDLVVFDLYRCHHYFHFHPVMLVPDCNWQVISSRNIPIVFWHSGECWPVAKSEFLIFAKDHTNCRIWYVDSNLNTETQEHLFFNSAETLNFLSMGNKGLKHNYNYVEYLPYDYKFSTVTGRGDLHKNIICNLISKELAGKSHFTDPQSLPYANTFTGLDNLCKTPDADPWLDYSEILNLRNRSMITVSLGTYFINTQEDWLNFEPCYITEKGFEESANNNPVMPVSHAGTIKYFRSLGIEFPDWIDFSYDDIADDNSRMHAVIAELHRLNTLDNLTELALDYKINCNNNRIIEKLSFKKDFDDILDKIIPHDLS